MPIPDAVARPELTRTCSLRMQRDLSLIEAARAGQPKAYEDLLAHYRKSVHFMVLRMVRNKDDADDLTQEIFTKAFRFLARYSPDFAFSTWLFRIATNHCIDFARRRKLRTQSLEASGPVSDEQSRPWELADRDPDPQQTLILAQRQELVQQLVHQLPAKYARIVHLRYFEELHYEEIAVLLELPLGTVKAQLFRARDLLLALAQKNAAFL